METRIKKAAQRYTKGAVEKQPSYDGNTFMVAFETGALWMMDAMLKYINTHYQFNTSFPTDIIEHFNQ